MPDLKIGVTFANFQIFGKVPHFNDELITMANGFHMKSATSLSVVEVQVLLQHHATSGLSKQFRKRNHTRTLKEIFRVQFAKLAVRAFLSFLNLCRKRPLAENKKQGC